MRPFLHRYGAHCCADQVNTAEGCSRIDFFTFKGHVRVLQLFHIAGPKVKMRLLDCQCLYSFRLSLVFCIKSLDWFFSRIWKQIFLAFFGPFYYAIHIHQFHVVNFKGPTCYPFIEKYKGKESKCSFDSKSLSWYWLSKEVKLYASKK